MSDRPTLLYDADCGFCRWSIGAILRADRARRLDVLPIQDPRAQAMLAAVAPAARLDSAHLVTTAGEVLSGGAATAPLADLLPGGGAIAALAHRFPRATDCGYRWVADHRGGVGRLVPARARAQADARIAHRLSS